MYHLLKISDTADGKLCSYWSSFYAFVKTYHRLFCHVCPKVPSVIHGMYSVSMYFITWVLRQLLTKQVQSKRFFNLHVQWLFMKYDGGKAANNQIQEQRFEAVGSTQEWAWADTLKVIFLKTSVSFSVSFLARHLNLCTHICTRS